MTKIKELIFYVMLFVLFLTVGICAQYDARRGMVPLLGEKENDQNVNNDLVHPSKSEQETIENHLNTYVEGPWQELKGNEGHGIRKKRKAGIHHSKEEENRRKKAHELVDADEFQKAWEKQQEDILLREMEEDVLRDENLKKRRIDSVKSKWKEEEKEKSRFLAEEEKKQALLHHQIDAEKFKKEWEKQQEAIILKEMEDDVLRDRSEKKKKIDNMKKEWKKEDENMEEKALINKAEEEENADKSYQKRHREWEKLQEELLSRNAQKDLNKEIGTEEKKIMKKEKEIKAKNREANENWENNQENLWLREMEEGDLTGKSNEEKTDSSKKSKTNDQAGFESTEVSDDKEEQSTERKQEKGGKVDKESINESKFKEVKAEKESAKEEKEKRKPGKTHFQETEEVSPSTNSEKETKQSDLENTEEKTEPEEEIIQKPKKVNPHFRQVDLPVETVEKEVEEVPELAQAVQENQNLLLHQEEADLLRAKEAEEKMIREAREIARRIKAIEDQEEVLSRREERRIQEFKVDKNKAEEEMKHKEEERRRLNSERERRRKEDELEEEKLWMEDQERQLRELRRQERIHRQRHQEYLQAIKQLEDKRIKLLNMEAEMKTRRENARGERVDVKFKPSKKKKPKKYMTRTPITLPGNHTGTPVDIMNAIRGLVEELKESNDSQNDVKHLIGKTKSKLIFLKYKSDQNGTGDENGEANTPDQISEWDELFSGIKPGNTTETDVEGDKIMLTKAAEFFNDFKDQQNNVNGQENSEEQSADHTSSAGSAKENKGGK